VLLEHGEDGGRDDLRMSDIDRRINTVSSRLSTGRRDACIVK
jgi:hypothetical protein